MVGLSLFSGIGGLDLAFEWAGGEVTAMCEIDPFCRKVLQKHWPGVPIYEDIKTLKGADVGAVDVIYGGYPCQPFSQAGKRGGAEDDRYLWPHFMRLVRELRPAWVVGENVAGHIRVGLDDVLDDLERDGYSTRAFCIPAGAIGAAHRRQRVFVVANTNGERLQRSVNAVVGTAQQTQTADAAIFASCRRGIPRLYDISTPRISRAGDGLPDRSHRIKALGNAVVPQQAYPIFRAIMETMA